MPLCGMSFAVVHASIKPKALDFAARSDNVGYMVLSAYESYGYTTEVQTACSRDARQRGETMRFYVSGKFWTYANQKNLTIR